MKENMKINQTIFREYDLRGIYEEQITDETAYILGKSFGSYVLLKGQKDVLVGYDNRLSSPVLANNLIKGLLETGVNVINLGLVTTPMYYYARIKLNKWAAIMLTASHNPSNHNGFKISFDEKGNAAGQEIYDFRDFTNDEKFVSGVGNLTTYDIKEEYIKHVIDNIHLGNKKIKVVFDAGNGTCGIIIKEILDKLNIEYDLLYCDSDGSFPNHHPDPSVSENLVDIQKRVVELNYDLGIALDADGDRVRIIDNKGNAINTDVFMIIMYRYLNDKLKIRKGLYDVKCSKALVDVLEELGLENIMYRTGNSYMYRKTREENLEFSGEYSGHIWFADRFDAIDDGIYAGLRMVEMLSLIDKNLDELDNNIPLYYSTDEIKIKTTEIKKVEIVKIIKEYASAKNYNFNDIDGVRVEFNDGWALIRHSNTGPTITVRFEANNNNRLEQIQNEFMNIINENL